MGSPFTRLGNFTFKSTDKFGKDTNFRGLTVFNNVVYYTKGSGSNGTNSVYFIDTTGEACSTTDGIGLPQPGATLPTLSGAPAPLGYQMCVLKGFNNLPAKGVERPEHLPVRDLVHEPGRRREPADRVRRGRGSRGPRQRQPVRRRVLGRERRSGEVVVRERYVELDYTIQAGLNLGQPYTVPATRRATTTSPTVAASRERRQPAACATSPARSTATAP